MPYGCDEIPEKIFPGIPALIPVIAGAAPIHPISTEPDVKPSLIAAPFASICQSIFTSPS